MSKILPLLVLVAALALAFWLLLGQGDEEAGTGPGGSTLALEGTGPGDLLGGTSGLQERATAGALESGARGSRDAAGDAESVRLRGRVLDERRRPVPAALVRLTLGSGRAFTATSDHEGAYTLELAVGGMIRRERGTLSARDEAGRVAAEVLWLAPETRDMLAPALVLETGTQLRLHVVRDGVPVVGAQVVATRRLVGTPSVLASGSTGSDGHVLLTGLPPGALEVYTAAAGSGRARTLLVVPRPAEDPPVQITLGAERQAEVIVLDAVTNSPIAGAEVFPGDTHTMPQPHGPGYLPTGTSTRTDRSGRAVLTGLSAEGTVYANARAPGYALTPWWMGGGRGLQAGEGEYRILLSREREVIFPVSAGGAGPPPDGAPLHAELLGAGGDVPDVSARMESGQLIVSGLPTRPANGVVRTADGAQGLFQAPAGIDMGGVVSFQASGTVVVRLVDSEGEAQAGVALRLDALGRGARIEARETDPDGLATFEGVAGREVAVYLVVPDQPASGLLLTKLTLGEDDEVHEVVLQRRTRLTLEVRIGQEPQLPAHYTLMVGERRVGAADIEEDPSAGLLRAWVRLLEGAGAVSIALHADGYRPALATHRPDGDDALIPLSLEAAGTLTVVVTPPDDGLFALRLERYDEAAGAWGPASSLGSTPNVELIGPQAAAVGGGEHAFEGLEEGRYRAFDAQSGVRSAEVRVVPGASPARVALDLGASRWIEGRVLAPAGSDLKSARVLVEGRDDPSNAWAGVRPDGEGSFRVRGRSGETLTLGVTHPTLSPAAAGGRVRVDPGAGSVELRLEAGALARFELAGREGESDGGVRSSAQARVELQDPKTGAGVLSVLPTSVGNGFQFGGFRPGTYRIVIVPVTAHAPLELPSVSLGEGETDLGRLTFGTGSTVILRLQPAAPEGASVWATVSHIGAPAYTRQGAGAAGATTLRCEGLGKGSFHLLVRAANLAPGATRASLLLDREIEVDGRTDLTIDIALR